MKLDDYVYIMTSYKQMSKDLRIGNDYLRQIATGHRKPSKRLAEDIEEYTKGIVTLSDVMDYHKAEDLYTILLRHNLVHKKRRD